MVDDDGLQAMAPKIDKESNVFKSVWYLQKQMVCVQWTGGQLTCIAVMFCMLVIYALHPRILVGQQLPENCS